MNTPPLSRPLRSPEVAWNKLGSEVVILDLKRSRNAHRLDPVASLIWEFADGSRSPYEIAFEVAERYDVALADCTADTEALLDALAAQGLLAEGPQAQDLPG